MLSFCTSICVWGPNVYMPHILTKLFFFKCVENQPTNTQQKKKRSIYRNRKVNFAFIWNIKEAVVKFTVIILSCKVVQQTSITRADQQLTNIAFAL